MEEEEIESYYKNFIYDILDIMFLIARKKPEIEKYARYLTVEGERLKIRPVSPKDDDAVLELYYSLSQETVYFRFFLSKKNVPKSRVRRYTRIDYERNFALVVERPNGKLIGIGRFIVDKEDPKAVEMAIVMTDTYQRKGIGSLLIKYLTVIAREKGIERIYATLLADNYKILKTINKLGFKFKKYLEDGDIRVEGEISPTLDINSLPFD